MHKGHYISGAGHLGLIAWMLLGGLIAPAPEPFEMTQVSVISGADFDAMIAAQRPPQTAVEVAQPSTPDDSAAQPDLTQVPDAAIEQPAPVPTETPPQDRPPEVAETAPPEDVPPEDLAEPVGDVAVLVPQTAPEAAPRPVERVAPEPVAQPAPEATSDPVAREAVAPDAQAEAQEQESQEATAPEEATTQIVTEATKAPAASSRPPGRRPAAPVQQAAQTPQPAETPAERPAAPAAREETPAPVDNADVLAALAAAQQAVSAPSGPPLSAGEKDALRVAVSQCWNIGSLSSEALGTTVVIGVNMNQNGTPVTDSIRMISASGGSDAAARRVFDSARRAIILCGARGYDLPAEKYGQWQKIEMTFDPRKMGY